MEYRTLPGTFRTQTKSHFKEQSNQDYTLYITYNSFDVIFVTGLIGMQYCSVLVRSS